MLIAISDVNDSLNLREIIKALAGRHEVCVVFVGGTDDVPIKTIQKEAGVEWFFVRQSKFFFSFANLKHIYLLIRETRGNSVLISGYKAQLHFILLGKLLGKHVTFIRHYTDTHHTIGRIHWWMLDVLMNALSDHIIAVSSATSSLLVKREWVRPRKISTINNAVDLERLLKVRQNRPLLAQNHKEPLRILSIARHVEIKGLDYILTALKRLEIHGIDFNYTIIGERTPYSEQIDRKVAEFPSGCIRLITDFVNVDNYLLNNHVLVHTPVRSSAESFGLVYIEGLVSGIECVFSQSGILIDSAMLSEDTYWKIEYKSAYSIEQSLIAIYRGERKQGLAKDNFYQNFSIQELKRNYISFMDSYKLD